MAEGGDDGNGSSSWMKSYDFVCWEWQRSDGGFCPFNPDVSCRVESAFMAGMGQFATARYIIDFKTMTHTENNVMRCVQRVGVDIAGVEDIDAYWTWEISPGNFVPYDTEATVDLELAYRVSSSSVIDLSKCYCRLQYTVSFADMKQISHVYSTERSVRRVPLPLGVTLQKLLKIPNTSTAKTAPGFSIGISSTASGYGASVPNNTSNTVNQATATSKQGISIWTVSSKQSTSVQTASSKQSTSVQTASSKQSTSVQTASSKQSTSVQTSIQAPTSKPSSANSFKPTPTTSSAFHSQTTHLAAAAASKPHSQSSSGLQASHTGSRQKSASVHPSSSKPSPSATTTTTCGQTSKATLTASVQVTKPSALTSSRPMASASTTTTHPLQASKPLSTMTHPLQASKPLSTMTHPLQTSKAKSQLTASARTAQPVATPSDDSDMLESYDVIDDMLLAYSSTSDIPSEKPLAVPAPTTRSKVAGFFGRAVRGAISAMSIIKYPLGWKIHPNSEDCLIVPLVRTSREYHRVEAKFFESMPKKYVISSIKRVQNRWLWVRYSQTRSQLQSKNAGAINEMELFHGSRKNPSDDICASEEGFDMRFSRKGLWGTANYFAVKAYYSHHYAFCPSDGSKARELILAKVLTGESIECESDQTLRLPPLKQSGARSLKLKGVRYDSVCGYTHNYKVYMTYSNDRAYPAYVIVYAVA